MGKVYIAGKLNGTVRDYQPAVRRCLGPGCTPGAGSGRRTCRSDSTSRRATTRGATGDRGELRRD
jgi:hypothetical protein